MGVGWVGSRCHWCLWLVGEGMNQIWLRKRKVRDWMGGWVEEAEECEESEGVEED